MQRADFACEDCGGKDDTLNIHHSYYEKGLMPWEYPDDALHCLCEFHHQRMALAQSFLLRQLSHSPDEVFYLAMAINFAIQVGSTLSGCTIAIEKHVVDSKAYFESK